MGLSEVKYAYTGGDRGWKGDVPVVRLDSSKIRSLGWKNKYTAAEAIRKSVESIIEDANAGRFGWKGVITMIVSRAPVRISMGGGGTDLPSYYEKFGGFLLAAGINKYVHILLNKRFEDSIRLSYSKTEIVDDIREIEHSIFRECLKFTGIKKAG
jgi:hypothetical protein